MSKIKYFGTVETTENIRIAVAIHDPEKEPEEATIHFSSRGISALANLNPSEIKELIVALKKVCDFQDMKAVACNF